ncbi:MAG TPA: UTP--glucose-1-phosphate uridylyltransferase [Candidatus Wildermuthbacteria bacterium]|nr:UTP--glucose-1-phosphate uridylyltransferase [Candidatus Wildermuthbacteria bacterium]
MLITKAIIPVAGLGTRFLPLTKAFPKELLPLVDKPLIQYSIEELKASGVTEIIFVVNTNKKYIEEYFKKTPSLEKLLSERKQDDIIKTLKHLDELMRGISFTYVNDKPLGDGHAVLQARKLAGDDPCFVVYPDDVIISKIPCVQQLANVFKTSEKPVLGLFRLPDEKLSSYGVVAQEPIARRLGKISEIVEKPEPGSAPSNLAIVGRRIITAEVFDYLKKTKPNQKGEVNLTEVFSKMVNEGKVVYGYEVDGEWLECGDKTSWLRSTLYLLQRDPRFSGEGVG